MLLHLLLFQAVLKGRVLAIVLRVSLLFVQSEGPAFDSFDTIGALQDLVHLVFNHGYQSFVSTEASDQLLFVSPKFNPSFKDANKCRDSSGVRRVSLVQANSTLKRHHEFMALMLQEEGDRLGVEAGVLPVLLNDSLNEESNVELVLEVLLIELVTGGIGIVSVLVVVVLLLTGFLNSLVLFALKVLLKNRGVFGEKLSSAIANLLLDLEVTESSTANVVVLEKLSVGKLDHLFKALEGKLTHGIQVVFVLASGHGIDVTLNMVERLEGLS